MRYKPSPIKVELLEEEDNNPKEDKKFEFEPIVLKDPTPNEGGNIDKNILDFEK